MTWNDVIQKPKLRVVRQFAGLCLLALMSAGAWQGMHHGRTELGATLVVAGVVCGLTGWFAPGVFRWVYTAAMIAVFPIGFIVSQIILLIVFYMVFLPLGLILRARGWDPMGRRRQAEQTSYWVPRKNAADRRSYFRQH